jgi:hypothetical protein
MIMANLSTKNNTSSHQTLSYLKNELNLNILNLTVNANYSIVISQVIRMFIGIFPKHIIDDDNAFVMTSDSDLTPFNIDYYNVNMDRVKKTITVWNAYCCGQFQFIDEKTYKMYLMGHIGRTKKNWRQAVELEEEQSGNLDGDLVLKKLFQIYGKEFKQDPGKGGNSWYADQQLVSVFVNRHATANSLTLDLRAYTGTRLDRSHYESFWNQMLDDNRKFTDSHLFQTQNAMTIRVSMKFLKKLFGQEIGLVKFYEDLVAKFWQFP